MEAVVIGIPYLPVALVCQMPDGQFVVLHGQGGVNTSFDLAMSPSYHTTIEWRRDLAFTQLLMTDISGVEVRVDGEQFRVDPLLVEQASPPGVVS